MTHPPAEKNDLFLRHLEPLQECLVVYCRRALQDRGLVADVLQSAVANAFRDFDLYAEGTNFRAWMFRYVTFEIYNRNRASSRDREVALSDDPADPHQDQAPGMDIAINELLEEPETVLDYCDEELSAGVLELPPTERSILLLRAIGEFKYREIAGILDVPIGTVMGLLSRSRSRLRNRLVEFAARRRESGQSKK